MDARIEALVNLAKTTDDIYPKPIPVEYDNIWLCEPDPIMDALKFREYVKHQQVRCDHGIRLVGYLRFDGSFRSDLFQRSGHKRFQEIAAEFYLKPYRRIATFEWEHSTLDYEMMLTLGIDGLREKIRASRAAHEGQTEKLAFLQALEIVCDGIDLWSSRLASECENAALSETPERAAELRETAAVCRLVPKNPARTFREAVQAMAVCFHFLPDSIGCVDRYLYHLYKADIASGKITRGEAKSLLQEFFTMIKAHTPLSSGNADKGGESHFAIGGYNENMDDSWNELSELVLESLMELPLLCPQLSVRWTKKMPFEILRHILDCERHDSGKRIALINDDPRIFAYTHILGHKLSDAVKYTTVGCNETGFPGSMDFTGMQSNIALAMTDMIYRDTEHFCACKSYEELFELFSRHLEATVDEMIDIQNKFNYARSKDDNVLSSLFMSGSIENAISVTKGGGSISSTTLATCGLISMIDSLIIIKQLVFDEKKVSARRLYEALQSNWACDEELRTYILRNGTFFGNNDARSNGVAQSVTRKLKELLDTRRDMFGNRILVGAMDGYNAHSTWFGNLTEATPDGRRSAEPFMVGVGQINGKDRKGLTALMLSVAHMDPEHILTASVVFNVSLDEPLIKDDRNFEKIARIIETYFLEGGIQIQLNYVSRDTLLKAQECPEQFGSLRVRVSGFSAYFTRLNADIQEEVIQRTEIKG